MKIITTPFELGELNKPVVLAVGFFDGVHQGHQEVLRGTVKRARECGGEAWVMTFDRHPLALLAPYQKPSLLSGTDERLALFAEQGIDGVLLVEFTDKIASLSPESFARWLCGGNSGQSAGGGIKEIRCGDNWRFGKRAEGTPTLLARFGGDYGFKVAVVPYTAFKGVEISSTRIRYAIREGRLDEANKMLGRAYSVRGTVVSGRGVGNRLAMATANIMPDVDLLPPNGVYAVRVEVDKTSYGGVANLGVRPTFEDTSPHEIVLETHLFNFKGALYNKEILIGFLSFLRQEIKFESTEKLVEQVAIDIRQAKLVLRRSREI